MSSASRPDAVRLLVHLTDGDLEETIRRAVREQLERPPRRLYSDDEVGHAIGCSGRQVRRLMAEGLPFVRVGSARRLDLDEVLQWLRARSEAEAAE